MSPEDTQGDTAGRPATASPVAGGGGPSSPAVAATNRRAAARDKTFTELFEEFLGLTISYARQECVDPLRALGRFLALGFAGAILIAIGWVLLALSVTRLIQAETAPHLHGNLSWVPYVGGVLTAVGGLAWAVNRISKAQK
jgi:hypothetical protein